jgi:hypothetical protein
MNFFPDFIAGTVITVGNVISQMIGYLRYMIGAVIVKIKIAAEAFCCNRLTAINKFPFPFVVNTLLLLPDPFLPFLPLTPFTWCHESIL